MSILSKSLKGSYTVEGAVIISICFIVFGMAVLLSFELFKESIAYVEYKQDTFNTVSIFRIKEGIVGTINAIRD
ncbi:hypothetical protein [Pseudobutyrivibrio xylanivorans]|uniref:ABC transporter permease n=1 Tax=Pseudobutyrivibrio xylanivorans TaxID=185007 RepID=A0A5P6VQV1_PSEXY|nr:hypothetical protein [Pseudobutyrivibrio xylanivorans]QFJ54069.1 hypothetical protein FXF36_03880 [Pseudobutyrivibrio xylanivorans]